jgi:hypothetical protein
MSDWVRLLIKHWNDLLDNTRSCPLGKHLAVKPFLGIQIGTKVHPIHLSLASLKPLQSQYCPVRRDSTQVKRYMRLIWVDCCRHTQCAVTSADCGAIFLFMEKSHVFWPELLHRHNCALHSVRLMIQDDVLIDENGNIRNSP